MAGTDSPDRRYLAAGPCHRSDWAVRAVIELLRSRSLLGDLQGIVDFDAKVPDGRLELRMPEEQLNGAQVLGAAVDQRRLRPSHRVRPVLGAVEAQLVDLVPEDPGVLSGP